MKNMTINEATELRKKLENKILQLVAAYEAETGLRVGRIYIERVSYRFVGGPESEIANIDIEVRVP